MRKCTLRLFMGLLWSHTAWATTNECTIESISNDCKVFKDNPDSIIKFEDGTMLPNFYRIAHNQEKAKSEASQKPAKREVENPYEVDDAFKYAIEISQVLDSSSRKTSEKFKRFILHKPKTIQAINYWKDDEKVNVPWPIDDEAATVKLVLLEDLRTALGEENLDKLKKADHDIGQKLIIDSFDRKPLNLKETSEEPEDSISRISLTLSTPLPGREKRVQELFEFGKSSVINAIRSGRSEAELSKSELAAIAKVKALGLSGISWLSQMRCQGIVPGASYNKYSHAVMLCQSMYNYPDAALVRILAHEIGHSVDPCNSQFTTYKINPQKSATEKIGRYALRISTNDPDQFTTAPYGEISEPQEQILMQKQIESGALIPIANGTPFDEYVFKDVYSCLTSKAGGNFFETSKAKNQEIVDNIVAYRRDNTMDSSYDPIKDRQQLLDFLEKNPQCVSFVGETHMGEAMGDWFGAKAEGEFLKGKSLTSSKEKIAALPFSTIACTFDLQPKPQDLKATISRAKEDFNLSSSSHPAEKKRENEILLREENIAKAVGCAEPHDKSCDHVPIRNHSNGGAQRATH